MCFAKKHLVCMDSDSFQSSAIEPVAQSLPAQTVAYFSRTASLFFQLLDVTVYRLTGFPFGRLLSVPRILFRFSQNILLLGAKSVGLAEMSLAGVRATLEFFARV